MSLITCVCVCVSCQWMQSIMHAWPALASTSPNNLDTSNNIEVLRFCLFSDELCAHICLGHDGTIRSVRLYIYIIQFPSFRHDELATKSIDLINFLCSKFNYRLHRILFGVKCICVLFLICFYVCVDPARYWEDKKKTQTCETPCDVLMWFSSVGKTWYMVT